MRLAVFADAFEGLGDVRGILLFDGRQLRLDFQTSDALFGLLKSDAKQLLVPLHAVEKVRCGLGWFWLHPYIELELNDFALLSKLPGSHKGSWRLRVKFADRHALRRFADAVAFARSGQLHEALERSLPEHLLPSAANERAQPPAPELPVRRHNEVQ
jgi:hypothetical protein